MDMTPIWTWMHLTCEYCHAAPPQFFFLSCYCLCMYTMSIQMCGQPDPHPPPPRSHHSSPSSLRHFRVWPIQTLCLCGVRCTPYLAPRDHTQWNHGTPHTHPMGKSNHRTQRESRLQKSRNPSLWWQKNHSINIQTRTYRKKTWGWHVTCTHSPGSSPPLLLIKQLLRFPFSSSSSWASYRDSLWNLIRPPAPFRPIPKKKQKA